MLGPAKNCVPRTAISSADDAGAVAGHHVVGREGGQPVVPTGSQQLGQRFELVPILAWSALFAAFLAYVLAS